LAVTQLASFNHTFTLSSVPNATIPAGDSTSQLYSYLHAHPPIVNLSLGSTPGKVFDKTFTAPTVGTYEFICIVHFAERMQGTMTVSSSSHSSTSPSAVTVPPFDIALAAGVAVVVIAAVVVVVLIRRRDPEPKGKSRRDRR